MSALVDVEGKRAYLHLTMWRTFVALSLFLAVDAGAAQVKVEDVVARVQKSYEAIRTIHAEFSQTYRSARFGDKTAEGSLVLEKPGKMLWKYSQPPGRILVSNGDLITLYDPADRQALITPQPEDDAFPVALAFLVGRGNLKKAFKITLAEPEPGQKSDTYLLRCLPREADPQVRAVYLKVRLGTPTLVISSKIVDAMDGENEIRFSKIHVNQPIKGKPFRFSPPKKVPLVPMSPGKVPF